MELLESQKSGFSIFLVLKELTSPVTVSDHTKCVSLSNQKCTMQPTLINLHPNQYTQGLCYYLFAVNLGRCVGTVILLMAYLIKYVFQMKQKI